MAAVLFLLTFLIYVSGLCGTIPAYRDSGDLIASISTLGIAHPPGYPTYVLLAHVFGRLIPLGNWAYRVNCFSAFCAAGSVTFLFKTLKTLLYSSPPQGARNLYVSIAAVISLTYALTPAVVDLAHVAEMYSCAALFAAVILFLMTSETPRTGLAVFLLGSGLGVHPTLLFLSPLFLVRRVPPLEKGDGGGRRGDPPRLPFSKGGVLFFLLGLSVFLFLPIRSASHPLQNWGDPSHWRNFWRVVTRADYGGLKLHPEQSEFHWTAESAASQIAFWGKLMIRQWSGVGFLVSLLGWAVWLLRGKQTEKWAFAACLMLAGPLFVVLSNLPIGEATSAPILQPYFVLGNLIWVLGIAYLFQNDGSRPDSSQPRAVRAAPPPEGWPGRLTACRDDGWRKLIPVWAGILLLVVVLKIPELSQASLRNDFYAYDYGRNLMRSLPSGALLYDPDDPTAFTLRALQVDEHRRTDLILLNFFRTRWGYEQMMRDYPDLLPPVPIENAADLQRMLWSYSIQRHPFYVELPQKLGKIPYHSEGIVYKVDVPTGQPQLLRSQQLLELYPARGQMTTTAHPDFFTSHLIVYYAAADNNLALEFANQKEWNQAVALYESALVIDPLLSAAYNNWGIVAYEQGNYVLAEALYRKAIQLEPGNVPFGTNLELARQAENHSKLP